MIKSELTSKEFSYPRLMYRSLCGEDEIVLFSSPNAGMTVQSNIPSKPIGYYSDDWYVTGFKHCNSKVVLENCE